MRRRIFIVAIFLLAGAVVNVAVAWGCACFYYSRWPLGASAQTRSLTVERAKEIAVDRFPGLETLDDPIEADGLGWHAVILGVHDRGAWGVSCGWPFLALAGEEERFRPAEVETRWILYLSNKRFVVPLRPLWRGFAVNSIFYAALMWLPICGPFLVRSWVRVRRGLCPKCAYPMGESAVCTECGKALREPAQ